MAKESNPKLIVVYGGGFQPFHEGHMSSYREAKKKFPNADFYVAASNVTSERPLEFSEKQFLAKEAGVADPFVQVGTKEAAYINDKGRKVSSTPLNPLEILNNYDKDKDVLVIIRSEKDPMKGGKSLTINTIASNVITFSANHGLALNSQIKANATSNGLTSGTTYFVISIPDLNQVTVSTVPGGTVHTLTDGTSLSISVTATSESYFQEWKDLESAEPFTKHAYIYYTKVKQFKINGTNFKIINIDRRVNIELNQSEFKLLLRVLIQVMFVCSNLI